MSWLFVLAGAAVGAPLRYLVDRAVQSRVGAFPWGTLTVNLVACAILGLLAGATTSTAVPEEIRLLVGVGLCGTLSTYSAFSYESLRLLESGARFAAVLNLMLSVVAGLLVAASAAALARLLLG